MIVAHGEEAPQAAIVPAMPARLPAPTVAATGLVIVLLDLRPEQRDVVPDSAGYLLVALAFWRLGTRERLFRAAGAAAVAAALLGLLEYAPGLLEGTAATLVVLAYNLAIAAALALAGAAFTRCALRADEDDVAGHGRWLARLALLSWLLLVVGVLLERLAAGPVLVGVAGVANVVVLLWLLVLLALRRTSAFLTG